MVVRSLASMRVGCCTVQARRISGGANSAGSFVWRQGLAYAARALLKLRVFMPWCTMPSCLVQEPAWLMNRRQDLVYWMSEIEVKIPGRFCPHQNEHEGCLIADCTARLRTL